MPDDGIEISVNGQWIRVPVLMVDGKAVFAKGKWIRLAAVYDEDWLESELEEPDLCVKKLKDQGRHGLRADILTFTQTITPLGLK